MKKRLCLRQDEDSHWYLVPADRAAEFESLCEKAYPDDEYEEFNERFESMRISGPQNLTFSDPKEE